MNDAEDPDAIAREEVEDNVAAMDPLMDFPATHMKEHGEGMRHVADLLRDSLKAADETIGDVGIVVSDPIADLDQITPCVGAETNFHSAARGHLA